MIFDIQRNSLVDGPGIRTVIFFSGCNLRCAWCHNPECMSAGREMSADELLKEILKDRAFYAASDGGVTFSGGECILCPDELSRILTLCRESGVHTAVDTAGAVPWENFRRVIPFTDLFLYDIKCASPELHRRFTGSDNALIIENLRRLSELGADIIIRIPIVGGFNDDEVEILKIRELLSEIRYSKLELLPYHRLGEDKYRALGKEPPSFYVPDENTMKKFKEMLNEQ